MDSGTMVRAAGDEMGTVRVASTMSDGANTMIEHDDTLPSQLGTMVINAEEEEEEGTMKSKALTRPTWQAGRARSRESRFCGPHGLSPEAPFCCHNQRSERALEGWGAAEGLGGRKLARGVRGRQVTGRDRLSDLHDHSLSIFFFLFRDLWRRACRF